MPAEEGGEYKIQGTGGGMSCGQNDGQRLQETGGKEGRVEASEDEFVVEDPAS